MAFECYIPEESMEELFDFIGRRFDIQNMYLFPLLS